MAFVDYKSSIKSTLFYPSQGGGQQFYNLLSTENDIRQWPKARRVNVTWPNLKKQVSRVSRSLGPSGGFVKFSDKCWRKSRGGLCHKRNITLPIKIDFENMEVNFYVWLFILIWLFTRSVATNAIEMRILCLDSRGLIEHIKMIFDF